MSSWILSTVTSQLPSLIEKYQPAIEKSLRLNLLKLKVSSPDQADLFYQNWKKLNIAVDETLGGTPPSSNTRSKTIENNTGGKRTRRRRRKHRK
jgi:hypothetical protein